MEKVHQVGGYLVPSHCVYYAIVRQRHREQFLNPRSKLSKNFLARHDFQARL
jgi:hypothetical protein